LKLTGALLFCGYTKTTRALINEMKHNVNFSQLTVVSHNCPDTHLSESGIKSICGDFCDPHVLSGILEQNTGYSAVIIFSEYQPGIDSQTVDMRTAIAAAAIRKRLKDAYIIVEIINSANTALITHLKCDEIIFRDKIDSDFIINSLLYPHSMQIFSGLFSQSSEVIYMLSVESLDIAFPAVWKNVLRSCFEEGHTCIGYTVPGKPPSLGLCPDDIVPGHAHILCVKPATG